MKLPNCPHCSTVTGLQSMTTESSSLIVLTSVSLMASTMTSHTLRWWQIVLPKPWAFRRSFMAKTEVSGGGVSRKWKLVTWGVEPSWWCNLIPTRLTAITGVHRHCGCFPVTMTTGIWPASLKLQIGTKLDRNGGQKRELESGRAKRVNFSLSLPPSLSCAPLSFLFWKSAPPIPFIETSFFFKDYYYLS